MGKLRPSCSKRICYIHFLGSGHTGFISWRWAQVSPGPEGMMKLPVSFIMAGESQGLNAEGSCLVRPEKREYSRQFGSHLENPG